MQTALVVVALCACAALASASDGTDALPAGATTRGDMLPDGPTRTHGVATTTSHADARPPTLGPFFPPLDGATYAVCALLAAVGVLFVVAGYRLFKPVLCLTAFAAAGFGSYVLLVRYTQLADENVWLPVGVAAALGVVAALLVYALIKIGFFVLGAVSGFLLAALVLGMHVERWFAAAASAGGSDASPLAGAPSSPSSSSGGSVLDLAPMWTYVVLGSAALIGGALGLLMQRPLLIVGTAFAGAFVMAGAADKVATDGYFAQLVVAMLRGNEHVDEVGGMFYVWAGVVVAVSLAGVLVQACCTSRGFDHRSAVGICGTRSGGSRARRDTSLSEPLLGGS